MEWPDGCPLRKGNSHTLEKAFNGPPPMEDCPPKWTDGKDFALAASHTSEKKIFYAFLSGGNETTPTCQDLLLWLS